MQTHTTVIIDKPVLDVWLVVIDIENSVKFISAINSIEVLDRGEENKVGFKWRESRTMMGKEAFETMWISEVEPQKRYVVLAENHGTKYTSTIELEPLSNSQTKLSMTFAGQPVGLFAKLMSAIMMPFFKGSITKMLHQDLLDIKAYVET